MLNFRSPGKWISCLINEMKCKTEIVRNKFPSPKDQNMEHIYAHIVIKNLSTFPRASKCQLRFYKFFTGESYSQKLYSRLWSINNDGQEHWDHGEWATSQDTQKLFQLLTHLK